MDMQAVMICLVMMASAVYYKSKLTVHNFTVYDMKTYNGYCNVWNESEGDLCASVFATSIMILLEEKVNFEERGEIII